MDYEESEIEPSQIYDIIISGGVLICSHCGERFTIDQLIDQKIVLGNTEGYLSHTDCLLGYIIKSEPIISSGLASGLFTETQIRHDLVSRPFESVVLDISRVCSHNRLTPMTNECSKFIASESDSIAARINYNLESILSYLDNSILDPNYSNMN